MYYDKCSRVFVVFCFSKKLFTKGTVLKYKIKKIKRYLVDAHLYRFKGTDGVTLTVFCWTNVDMVVVVIGRGI